MSFLKEFRDFAIRGNMMDLAVGMIVGAAFTSIVKSLVDDLINPVLGLFTGKIDFVNLFISLNGEHYETLAKAEEAGAAVLKYGSFISAFINFLIMAFVVFLIVKAINKVRELSKKEEPAPEPEPTTKKCPFCMSEININATRCPHCTSELPAEEKTDAPKDTKTDDK